MSTTMQNLRLPAKETWHTVASDLRSQAAFLDQAVKSGNPEKALAVLEQLLVAVDMLKASTREEGVTANALIYNVGDRIEIKSASGYQGHAQIVALRHAIGNYRTNQLSFGADCLCHDGKTRFYFLHDISRWNPEKLKPLAIQE